MATASQIAAVCQGPDEFFLPTSITFNEIDALLIAGQSFYHSN